MQARSRALGDSGLHFAAESNMKKLIVFLVLLLLAVAGSLYYFSVGDYSEGFRAGTVIKLSRKGIVFKTFEGQLNLGMVLSEGNSGINQTEISNLWEFSVLRGDTAVRADLERVILSGRRAKLHYEEKFVKLPWRGDTRYVVTSVEVLPEDRRPTESQVPAVESPMP